MRPYFSVRKQEEEKEKCRDSAAVMIIASLTPPPLTGWIFRMTSPEVIPQTPAHLLADDRQVLKGLGIYPYKWNDLNALLGLYNKTELYDVFSVQVSRPEMELSRSYILEQIGFLLTMSTKKNGDN